ncbi:MAG TPA: polymer-forming cytoskeletal protein [Longimicrobiales bacterium]
MRPRPTILNGTPSGDIASTGALIVGERAVVRANVRADSVVGRGDVIGDITTLERIEVKSNARVVGDLIAPEVVVDSGARFEGTCRMGELPAAPLAPNDLILLRGA